MTLGCKVVTLSTLHSLLRNTTINVISTAPERFALYNSNSTLEAQVTIEAAALRAAGGLSFGDVIQKLGLALQSAGAPITLSQNGARFHAILPALDHESDGERIEPGAIANQVTRRLKPQGDSLHFRLTLNLPRTSAARSNLLHEIVPVLLADVTSFFELTAYNHKLIAGQRCVRLHLLVTEDDRDVLLTPQTVLPSSKVPSIIGVIEPEHLAQQLHGIDDSTEY